MGAQRDTYGKARKVQGVSLGAIFRDVVGCTSESVDSGFLKQGFAKVLPRRLSGSWAMLAMSGTTRTCCMN